MDNLRTNIKQHLNRLCLVPSRHVGSPGIAEAADYIGRTFCDYGYSHVGKESFPATGWRFGSMVFVDLDNGAYAVPGALPCFFSRSADVAGVPLWLTPAELQCLTPEMVRGKLCVVELFQGGSIRGRNGVAEDLDALGAAGAVFISPTLTHAANTKIQRSPLLRSLGAAVVEEPGAYYLARNRTHRFLLRIDADTFPCSAQNVVAIRPGSGTKRAVFGAHHDAAPLTQGACDNASGVACLLELARLLRDELPEWTFEFVSFDAEEYCIHETLPAGSEAYVRCHADRKWEFFMDFDCVGVHFGEDVLNVGRGELLPQFECIYPKRPFKNGGDERNFDRIGLPTIWFESLPMFKEFHTPMDTIETLDTDRIARCVAEAVEVVRRIC